MGLFTAEHLVGWVRPKALGQTAAPHPIENTLPVAQSPLDVADMTKGWLLVKAAKLVLPEAFEVDTFWGARRPSMEMNCRALSDGAAALMRSTRSAGDLELFDGSASNMLTIAWLSVLSKISAPIECPMRTTLDLGL